MTNKEKQAYLEYLQEFCQARGDVREVSREVQIIQEVGRCIGITWDDISAAIDAAKAKEAKEVTFAHFDAEGVDVQVLKGNADVMGYVSNNGLISFDRFGNITYVERGDEE